MYAPVVDRPIVPRLKILTVQHRAELAQAHVIALRHTPRACRISSRPALGGFWLRRPLSPRPPKGLRATTPSLINFEGTLPSSRSVDGW